MPVSILANSFNAGELSPYMDARLDVEKYRNGCKTLENFIILPYGGVIRRGGTEYLGAAKFANRRCRLIGFNFSTTTRFVIEMGHQYMRFWSNGVQVLTNANAILEVASPFTESQLREVQFVQINDIMYLVHPDVAPHKLSRVADNNWTLAEVAWTWPALLDENLENTTLSVSHTTGNNRTMTASAATFNANHVGSYWQIGHDMEASYVEKVIDGNGTSDSLAVFGDWEFSTSGVWSALITIEQSEDDGATWQTIRNYKGAAERNLSTTGKTENEVKLRIRIADYSTGPAWSSNSTFAKDDIRVYENNVYRCVLAHNNIAANWSSQATYAEGDFVTYNTKTYKCIKTHTNATVNYANNTTVAVGTQFRCPTEQDGFVFRCHTAYAAVRSPWSGTWPSADKFANQIVQESAGTSAFWRVVTSVFGPAKTYGDARQDNDIQMLSSNTPQEADYEMNRLEKIDYRPTNFAYWEPIDFTPFNAKYWTPINYETRVARLEALNNVQYGVVKVTGYTSPTQVAVNVVNPVAKTTATKNWAEGAWSNHRGHPRTVMLHESRIWFGGTASKPQSLWASVVDDFENMRISDNADAGIAITLSSKEANRINWLESQDKLMIGTSGNEWTLGSSNPDEGITPLNVTAQKQSAYGSKYLPASTINDVMLFVQRQGRKVRELTYVLDRDGWVAPDLTVLAEHVTNGEIVESDYQQQNDAIYWAIRGDGQLIGMTYERDQQVVGWHRHTTDGDFESVAVIYGVGTSDEVWLSVKRTVNGQAVRYIERFHILHREHFENEAKNSWWYLDCAVRRTGSASATMSGLSHLEGLQVSVLADGAAELPRSVSGGQITLDKPASVVLAGLPFNSTLQPMTIDVNNLQDGTSRGRRKRIHKLVVSVTKSLGGQVSTNGTDWEWLYPRDFNDQMDASPNPFTGDKEVVVASDYDAALPVYIRQQQPYPLSVLAIVAKVDFYGD